jgi:hypothetical protein
MRWVVRAGERERVDGDVTEGGDGGAEGQS